MSDTPIQGQLPLEIRLALKKAAAIKQPLQRIAAIEAAQAKGRALFPKLFQAVGPGA